MYGHEHETDHGLVKRIRNISLANYLIGAAELVGGIITNSSTLTMAGVHDAVDGGLYGVKSRAAREQDPARKTKLRRRGAIALMGAALTFGSFEIASDVMKDDHQPESTAAAAGIVAAGVNIGAAGLLHGKRHHHDAHDSWRHVVGVDIPGSVVTLVVAPLSVRYPELDMVGAGLHMALATRVGLQTLQQTNGS